jgi:uncharacterized protein YjdB/endonuclease I
MMFASFLKRGIMLKIRSNKIITSLLVGASLFSSIFALTQYASQSYQEIQAADPTSGASYFATNLNDQYYQGIDDSLTGENLMVALSTLTSSGFVSYSYSSLPTIYQYSDASLTNSKLMQMVYTGTEVSFTAGSMPSNANKEHVWPASWYGNGTRTESPGSPGADAHNVWPSATALNSKRGSCAFDELDFATSYKSYEFSSSDWSYGTTGDNDSYVWSTAFNNSNGQADDALYPSRGNRGAIARILMYVATRYRNTTTYPVKLHDRAVTLNTGRIGKLSTLLKWHYQEPPSAWEIKRNNEVATRWHHNRNPFVDHPEYATKIFYYLPEPDQTQPTAAVKNVIETFGDISQSLSLNHDNVTLQVGQTQQLSVVTNPNSETITWSSSNPSVATVSQSGLITAKSVGSATITAQGTQTSDTCEVIVEQVQTGPFLVTGVTFTPSSSSIKLGDEITISPTISPSNATNKNVTWSSSDTGVATIDNGHIVGVGLGTATITATATDGSGKSGSYSITVTQLTTGQSAWTLVNDAGSLTVGDRLVIAGNNAYTAGNIADSVMASLSTTFSGDSNTITTLNVDTIELTLGGSSGAWTLSNSSNQLLGSTAVKNLAWGTGTTTWSISITNGNATIQNTTQTFGRFLYNVSAPRFTTYTSGTSTSMLLPQLYRYVEATSDPIKVAAYNYASTFMDLTSTECVQSNVQLSTWNSLANSYQVLSVDTKNYYYDHFENDPIIVAMYARYSVIVDGYHYSNFLVDGTGNPIVPSKNPQVFASNDNHSLAFLTIFVTLSTLSVIIYTTKVKKKSTKY